VPWRKDLDVRGTGGLGLSGESVSSMLDPSFGVFVEYAHARPRTGIRCRLQKCLADPLVRREPTSGRF